MRYNGAGLEPIWPGVDKIASEEGSTRAEKVVLSKGSTHVKKDAFLIILCLEVVGESGRRYLKVRRER